MAFFKLSIVTHKVQKVGDSVCGIGYQEKLADHLYMLESLSSTRTLYSWPFAKLRQECLVTCCKMWTTPFVILVIKKSWLVILNH